ncbi:MAG: polyprenyl synthetase family protein [Oceanicaulis sp.]|uniref:polyprenyl synthetase family protein n=1 Tax=Glycocaulis sp. TaxID=1969725 RepID=UPI0025C071D6|nr:farnesyl diphosphate synthase [Glycocaulis sp.]MCC5981602.1 polyprenyl synthetase family protein [Oceanicaulis sp.]MCH8522414.1 polyprenyl synthetase family protein [Glycocaulis sp.]
MASFQAQLEESADRVTVALDALLARPDGPEARLASAMRYAALGPGKRIRPFLTLAAGRMLGADERGLLRAGAAIECIHAYSLVHDDLPAMDDDAVRRGRPTVHIAYDEATAILAGDALQSAAFEIMAGADTHPSPKVRLALVEGLAKASGARGMAGGQMIDMLSPERHGDDIGVLTRLHRMKTGALISFSVDAGAILAEASADARQALEGYAHDLGLIYQIVDDLLDAEGLPSIAGKAVNKDARQGKTTFVTILGVDGARERARHLAAQAKEHLDLFGTSAKILEQCVDFVLERRS